MFYRLSEPPVAQPRCRVTLTITGVFVQGAENILEPGAAHGVQPCEYI